MQQIIILRSPKNTHTNNTRFIWNQTKPNWTNEHRWHRRRLMMFSLKLSMGNGHNNLCYLVYGKLLCKTFINLHCMHIIMQLDIWFNAHCWLYCDFSLSRMQLFNSKWLTQAHILTHSFILCVFHSLTHWGCSNYKCNNFESVAFCSASWEWQVGLRFVSWMNKTRMLNSNSSKMNGFEC